ncbi:ATP-binding protein [soil metagenome]
MFFDRRALGTLERHLGAARGVVLNGPRQSGKTELLRAAQRSTGGSYVTLDDRTQLRAARTDPTGFVAGRQQPLFVDEVQRGGDPLVLALKVMLDGGGDPGQVVLAGSTRFLFEPRLSESLAGRVRFVDLWPMSQGEIEAGTDDLVDVLFEGPAAVRDRGAPRSPRADIAARICRGGFPEAVLAPDARSRDDFLADYVRSLTQRDVLELAAIRQVVELPRLLRVLAARTAQELVPATVANEVDMGDDTTRRYLPLLEVVYAYHRVPAWSGNRRARAVRRPKLHLTDAGVAAHLLGVGPAALADPAHPLTGPLLETFVAGEVARQLTWSETRAELFHWRVRSGPEVDLVLEAADGRVVGIEVKAAASVHERDLRWLAQLRDDLGDRFVQGVVLACTDQVVPFGDRLTVVPVSALWSGR